MSSVHYSECKAIIIASRSSSIEDQNKQTMKGRERGVFKIESTLLNILDDREKFRLCDQASCKISGQNLNYESSLCYSLQIYEL